MISYSSLTPDQCEQVEHLFMDALFGTNPNHYLYELKNGSLQSQRTPLAKETWHCGKIRQVHVSAANKLHLDDSFVRKLTGWVVEDLLKAAGDVPPIPCDSLPVLGQPRPRGADRPE